MPWKPLPRIAFGVCIYPFHPSSAADLPLQIGDELYIIEQGGKDGAWYRGYLVAPPSLLAGLTSSKGQALEARVFSGIFPRDCVEVRELLGEVTKYSRDDGTPLQLPEIETSGTQSFFGEWPAPPQGPLSGANAQASTFDGASDAPTNRLPPGQKPPAPVPMLKIGDETATSKQEPLVDEIASCLREWHSTNLHQLLLNRRYDLLEDMTELVNRLDSARRQLIHQILTTRELDDVREATIWDLAAGNKALSGEVIVRSSAKRGKILTAEDSVVEISKLQSMMSLLNERPKTHPEPRSLHHLLFQLTSFINDAVRPTTFTVAIYSVQPNAEPTIISEVFAIDASAQENITEATDRDDYRTLFTDLNIAHLKATSSADTEIYLIVKVITNEPILDAKSSYAQLTEMEPKHTGGLIPPNSPFYQARRSIMLSSFGNASKRNTMLRPNTGQSKKSERGVSVSDERQNMRAQGGFIKCITGVGALNITDILWSQSEIEQQIIIWSPSTQDGFKVHHKDWDPVIPTIFKTQSKTYDHSSNVSRVRIGLRAFLHHSSEGLIQATPTVLQSIHPTKNIGFAEAPTRPRSDIYLTLCNPHLPHHGSLAHPKSGSVALTSDAARGNLQLTLEVRNGNGDRISNCIFPSSNSAGHTAWRTTAVEKGSSWNQTIKLAISPDDVPGCHIVMSIADATVNFPFALAWMPLWLDDAFVRDGEHPLILYKYDEHTSEMISGKRAYLALPWSSKAKDESVTGPTATLRLRTYLCSTKYSQDPTLLGILRWREQRSFDLSVLLRRFSFIPDMEIVKLLNDVFNSLFEILVHYNGDDDFEDLVFHALVLVLGVVHDRRFNLQPMVTKYAETQFDYPFAFASLMNSFCRLLNDAANPDTSRKLRTTCKVGSDVFKFIVKAREQQILKEQGIGLSNQRLTFAKDLQSIFSAVENVMRDNSPVMIGTRTLLVQNFHTWLPELAHVFSPGDISNISSDFIDACSDAQGKLLLYRLALIRNITASSLLPDHKNDSTWHENILRWLDPYWKLPETLTQPWRDQIRLCCSVVAAEFERSRVGSLHWLQKLVRAYAVIEASPRAPTKAFSLLFPSSFPLPTKPLDSELVYDESLIELAALVVQMTPDALKSQSLPNDELTDLLISTLNVYKSVLNCEAFPASWLTLHIYYHEAAMRTLQPIYRILSTRFLPKPDEADEFPTDVWNEFFSTLLFLVASNALALETFPEQKRRAVWKIAGDVREAGAKLLEEAWDNIGWDARNTDRALYGLTKMGGYQVQYVPGLVSPIVRLCLSVHEGLRGAAINVLRIMIISEWALSQDLSVIQTEIINCLDKLFRTNPPSDGMLHKIFVDEILESFEALDQLQNQGLIAAVKTMFGTVEELLSLLVAVHSSAVTGEALQIMDTLRLMEFLRDMNKELIYVGYVHKLAQAQIEAGNHTEAGLALKLHAELYDWDGLNTLDALEEPHFPPQSSFERKEQLYFQMIHNFEEGQAWQLALNAYGELAHQYQHNVFDFAKLARCQRAMASIHDNVSRIGRYNTRYFRVLFRGLGFPLSLRDKQFIYEGSPADRMNGFVDKLLKQYPSAQIVANAAVDDLEGQYLTVYPVGPLKNFTHPVNRRAKVAPGVRDHFIQSQPNQFSMTSRRQASVSTMKEQLQEKIVYTTADKFPTILRRSEIVKTETIQLTPTQAGLERVLRKTQELAVLEEQAQDYDDASFDNLTDLLRILVRPGSSGNVAGYWMLLPRTQSRANNEDDQETPQSQPNLTPLDEALRVALFDHAATIRKCLSRYLHISRQQTRAELTANFEDTFRPILNTINSITDESIGDLANSRWLWNLSGPNPDPDAMEQPPQQAEPGARAGPRDQGLRIQTAVDNQRSIQSAPISQQANGFNSSSNEQFAYNKAPLTSVPSDQTPTPTTGGPPASAGDDSGFSNRPPGGGLQRRVGKVTRRLSALNMGKKGQP